MLIESSSQPNSKLVWTGRVLSTLVLVPMLLSLYMKIVAKPEMMQGFTQLGLPMSMLKTLIVLESMSIIFYAIPQTAVLGAILLTGYMGGAICTHLRVGQSVPIQTLIGVLAWLGLFLREPRLRTILPFRR